MGEVYRGGITERGAKEWVNERRGEGGGTSLNKRQNIKDMRVILVT